jgi:glutamate/tyrosine decarboxylase-like PLP-dependent enzyme
MELGKSRAPTASFLQASSSRFHIGHGTIEQYKCLPALGQHYTGHFKSAEETSEILDEYEKEAGEDMPFHGDGASCAFLAPYTQT